MIANLKKSSFDRIEVMIKRDALIDYGVIVGVNIYDMSLGWPASVV